MFLRPKRNCTPFFIKAFSIMIVIYAGYNFRQGHRHILSKINRNALNMSDWLHIGDLRPVLANPASGIRIGADNLDKNIPLENSAHVKTLEEFESLHKYENNQLLSEKMSSHRTLKDRRPSRCLKQKKLARRHVFPASIIIAFRNENWSVLLRTIFSVLHNTPDAFLGEILLVDDHSDVEHLRKPLESYVKKLPKVRVIRLIKRRGIVAAKRFGVLQAKDEVVVFLHSHCEVTTGWLHPLIQTVSQHPTALVSPVLFDINHLTFNYAPVKKLKYPMIGGFTWDLKYYNRIPSKEEKTNNWVGKAKTNFKTPALDGAAFAVQKSFFLKIGGYDQQLTGHGSENMDLSLRAWLCGGEILIQICSHVGHVVRPPSGKRSWHDALRTSTLWLDDYRDLFQKRVPPSVSKISVGNLRKIKRLKKELRCHDFNWYIANIYPDLYFPKFNSHYFGAIKNVAFPKMCLEVFEDVVTLVKCTNSYEQNFEYNSKSELRASERFCLTYLPNESDSVTTEDCPSFSGATPKSMQWKYSALSVD